MQTPTEAAPTLPGAVRAVVPLGPPPWATLDPFLFCMFHRDAYPKGNAGFGPAAPLDGRDLGQDFEGKDGWRMYHGQRVPGFPPHPHRGFETVTIVRSGFVDHADSLGAAARYGNGDVQWLTAGRGVQHSEMFPLVNRDRPNPTELFQIWVNLPRANKLAEPHFSMFWSERIPKVVAKDEQGGKTEVVVVAGELGGARALPPPPASRAAQDPGLAIWTLKLEPGARFTLPAAGEGLGRVLYFFEGPSLRVGGTGVPAQSAVQLRSELPALLEAGPAECELLLLQGRPLGEPVAQYGPFVMSTRAEIEQAFADYRRTQFGGWTWGDEPVHGTEGRFAKRADGSVERPE